MASNLLYGPLRIVDFLSLTFSNQNFSDGIDPDHSGKTLLQIKCETILVYVSISCQYI